MSSGSARAQGGFTYVAMLLAVLVIGIGLAATGQVWSTTSQRDRERELLFIGQQFRSSIQAYYLSSPGGVKRFPNTLDDLLQDNRYPTVKRHLRRIYRDPMTGKPEWGLVKAPGGGIQGVYSLSTDAPLKKAGFAPALAALQDADSYTGWRFVFEPDGHTSVAPR